MQLTPTAADDSFRCRLFLVSFSCSANPSPLFCHRDAFYHPHHLPLIHGFTDCHYLTLRFRFPRRYRESFVRMQLQQPLKPPPLRFSGLSQSLLLQILTCGDSDCAPWFLFKAKKYDLCLRHSTSRTKVFTPLSLQVCLGSVDVCDARILVHTRAAPLHPSWLDSESQVRTRHDRARDDCGVFLNLKCGADVSPGQHFGRRFGCGSRWR